MSSLGQNAGHFDIVSSAYKRRLLASIWHSIFPRARLLTATEDNVEFHLKTALISVIVFFRLAPLKEV